MVYVIFALKVLAVVSIIALWIYGQYWKARKAEASREHKSGIQTLFSGKK